MAFVERTVFDCPESSSTVQVRVIDAGTILHVDPKLFWSPQIPNFRGVDAPIYCFLITNGSRHVIFDLGLRADWQNYSPRMVSLIKATTTITPGSDVLSVIENDTSGLSITGDDIEAVIWSHNHFDHVGDISRFPPATALVVGPGVRKATWPGYPSVPDALTLDADAEGREVREVSFGHERLKIGGFDAFDYFGDGSFYLLDAPGHATGHLCGLARTSTGMDEGSAKSSFVFFGADACHHAGILRPSSQMPLPRNIELNATLGDGRLTAKRCVCPGDLLHQHLVDMKSAFFTVDGPLFADLNVARETVAKIQELDAADNVLVMLAHDLSIREKIPVFPEIINDWVGSDLKASTRWLFCHEFLPALAENSVSG